MSDKQKPVSKSDFKARIPEIRERLLSAQHRLAASSQSAIIIIAGAEGTGKHETVDTLHSWMDTRGIETSTFDEPTDEERRHPRYWRYWRALPATGRLAVFFGSWYTRPILNRTLEHIGDREFQSDIDRIYRLEAMLAQENVILIKLWLHLDKKLLYERLQQIATDPLERWRIHENAWKYALTYDGFLNYADKMVRETDSPQAAWHIVDGTDERGRLLNVVDIVINRLNQALQDEPKSVDPAKKWKATKQSRLSKLDYKKTIAKTTYKRERNDLQGELAYLTQRLKHTRKSMIVVFEGPDAAGKGGSIRRLTRAMDARNYRVMSVAAPTDEEAARPYLWRFWRKLPAQGHTTIYDRSWYGRVLVERVEKLSRPTAWQRAYTEINDFERELSEAGIFVIKFWIAITPEEQLARFEARKQTPYKQHKLTEEDWRNRKKWDAYTQAAEDMFARCGTEHAPWTLVAGNDKRRARIQVLQTVVGRLHEALD